MIEFPREWGRLLTAMAAPFDEALAVDLGAARRLAAYLVDEMGNDGLVVSGTTGESPTLSDDEKLGLLDAVLEEVGGRAAVVMGCGTYNTAESAWLTQRAERAGAHGIMLVNPYYSRPGQAGLFAHFSAVAAETSLPVMLYNIQPRSAINLETETLLRLIDACPNIVAVKEASGQLGQISEVIRRTPEGFRVYSGDDALTLPILALGGYGLVSVAAHLAGPVFREMIASFESDPGRARVLHHEVSPVIEACFAAPNPVPVKFGLSQRGVISERVRLPLVPLDEGQRERLGPLLA
jgi:4-hydroxy-tetrahydrodipicolinate synthase